MIPPLEPPDSFHLQAAEGWIDLGDYNEATQELERITTANRAHPDVLHLRCLTSAEARDWHTCLDVATAMTDTAPERSFGWFYRAKSLDRLGRAQEAVDLLLSVVKDFASDSNIALQLAWSCLRLGRSNEVIGWLEKAAAAADNPEELSRLRKLIEKIRS